jgi:anti-anti-sigma regulatory factor
MKVKIDTKEKFHVITIEEPVLSANMTEDLTKVLLPFLEKTPGNLVINLGNVGQIDEQVGKSLANIQQTFYEANRSLVICNLQPEIETFLDKEELLEEMNITPTESEAGDIVQMEEIERELF